MVMLVHVGYGLYPAPVKGVYQHVRHGFGTLIGQFYARPRYHCDTILDAKTGILGFQPDPFT